MLPERMHVSPLLAQGRQRLANTNVVNSHQADVRLHQAVKSAPYLCYPSRLHVRTALNMFTKCHRLLASA